MRITLSISAAFFVTLALFYLMQTMIRGGGQDIEKPENYGVVDFVRLQRTPEDTQSQPLKRALPRKPSVPRGSPPSSEMKLAAVQPPAAAQQSRPLTATMQPMQLGRPYLGPLTAVIPQSVMPEKPAIINKIKTPSKPASIQKIETQPANVAKAPSVDKGASSLSQVSPARQPLASGSPAPIGAAPGLPGDMGNSAGEAVPVFKMKPKYPRKAARSRIEGWVKVEFTITEKGSVTEAMVVDSRPRRTFDRSAVQSIRKWRFKPMVLDGKPVPRKASQVIEFKLAKG